MLFKKNRVGPLPQPPSPYVPPVRQPVREVFPDTGTDANPELDPEKIITYEDLKLFTNDFSKENLLGRSQFGILYRGKIPQGWRGSDQIEKDVTVKIWSSEHVTPSGKVVHDHVGHWYLFKRLKDEIRFMGMPFLDDQGTVGKVLGYCFERINKWGVVFDLKPLDTLKNIVTDSKKFGWRQRFKVALGLARFLELCHCNAPKYLVRNLSAGNVVIDQDFNPVIVDFSRILGGNLGDDTFRYAPIFTYGYTDFSIALIGGWCEKTDVFMFGVLLLELLIKTTCDKLKGTAIWSKNYFFIDEGLRLVCEAELSQAENGEGRWLFVHKYLQADPDFDWLYGFALASLAMSCVGRKRYYRPYMEGVVSKLEKLHIATKHEGMP